MLIPDLTKGQIPDLTKGLIPDLTKGRIPDLTEGRISGLTLNTFPSYLTTCSGRIYVEVYANIHLMEEYKVKLCLSLKTLSQMYIRA